MLIGLKF